MSVPEFFANQPRPGVLSEAQELLNTVRRELRGYYPSPADWRDEVLYFLLPDRFSDGNEAARSLLTQKEIGRLRKREAFEGWSWADWAESGKRWQGGTLKGIASKLDYLEALGVTTLWIGPVFKQRKRMNTSHGYGIQDFLEIDPRFGTRADLIALVEQAHQKKMRVILDIIFNHSGDNWGYVKADTPLERGSGGAAYRPWPQYYGEPDDPGLSEWKIVWRDERQAGLSDRNFDIRRLDDGVWPRELQQKELYTRAGSGDLGSGRLDDPHAEHKRSDFLSLKDFALDTPAALSYLAQIYKYWIALSDCDGFRIDTVKHVSLDEARNFCGTIKEFAETLGKRNFFLVGELAGGEEVQDYYLDALATMQRNMNAALDIGNARLVLTGTGKGLMKGSDYFGGYALYGGGFGSHRSLGDQHVSILDDHDHVFGKKLRFSAEIPDGMDIKAYQIVVPTALQLFSLGIPCIYYGSEQAFSGPPQSQVKYLGDHGWGQGSNWGDRYLRECMFGPEHPHVDYENSPDAALGERDARLPGFGAFGTAGKHCFDRSSPAFVRIAALNSVRSAYPALRVGRQYQRAVRFGIEGPFIVPEVQEAGSLIAWSRILDNQEGLCVVNPNAIDSGSGDVVVSAELWRPGERFTVVANTAHSAGGNSYSGTHPIGSSLSVECNGEKAVCYLPIRTLPACEVLVLIKEY